MTVRIVKSKVPIRGDRAHLVALVEEGIVNTLFPSRRLQTADLLTDQKGGDSFQ